MVGCIIIIIVGIAFGIIDGVISNSERKMTPDEASRKLKRGLFGILLVPVAIISGLTSNSKKKKK
jgi:hypothetical protein